MIRLEEIRRKAGLSRAELSELSGISLRTIERYEQGRSEPKYKTALKLCKALGCSVEILMGSDERAIEVKKEIKTIVLEEKQ